MASGGSDLRTRMSAEDHKLVREIALKHFKEHKVEISGAIKASFPFFESLHERGFITKKMYKKSKRSCKDPSTVPEVVYDILDEMEEKRYLSLLELLFSKTIMKNYPDLNGIYEDFRDVILKKVCDRAKVNKESAENAVTQLSLEQGTGENPYPRLSWLFPDVSDHTVISSDDSTERRNSEERPKASTSELKRKPGARQQPGVSVNFRAQILPVTCGEITGLLIKRKLEQGATRKCIRTEDGNWLTPREFEVKGGKEKASNWKTSLTCGGKTLKRLMELRFLHPPPFRRRKKGENSDKCKICQDGGKLFRCDKCQSFFHGGCHLPPVDTKRNDWNCTLCKIKNSSGSQQRYRKLEVLAKPMRPEEKLKCECLLLKVYGHLESNVFPSIPHNENYVRKASQYVVKLRKLDMIKKKLIKGKYPKVKDFVQAMNEFFWDPRRIYSYLSKKEFMKDFEELFAIRKTN